MNSAWSPDHFGIQYFLGSISFSLWCKTEYLTNLKILIWRTWRFDSQVSLCIHIGLPDRGVTPLAREASTKVINPLVRKNFYTLIFITNIPTLPKDFYKCHQFLLYLFIYLFIYLYIHWNKLNWFNLCVLLTFMRLDISLATYIHLI